MPADSKKSEPISSESALTAILALMVADRERADDPPLIRTEVLLSQAGLTYDEISAVTGKTPGAIRKIVERARARRS